MQSFSTMCFAVLFAVGLCTAGGASAAESGTVQSERHSFRVVTLVRGLAHPWSVAFLPDGRMLVTERVGRLRLVTPDFKLDPRPIEAVPRVITGGQAGLFDVALHPEFARNGWIYLSYAGAGDGGWSTELMRARLDGHRLVDQQVLFRQLPKSRAGVHFGGRIVFDNKGFVYLTLGDRGEMDRAQRAEDHAGSVIRLHDDGRVPDDNPYVRQAGVRPEKYTMGQRNIQGAALHPRSGELWTHEHGPQGGDEINVARPGRNYGWPVITHGVNYGVGTRIGEGPRKTGMEQPLHHWVPSIAPSGMAFYGGQRFPGWQGNLFVGALKDEMLVRLELDGEKVVREERLIRNALGRIRDVRAAPDGYLYIVTDEANGVLSRLEPL